MVASIYKDHSVGNAVDGIQRRITEYACDLGYDDLTPQAIHQAKALVIDTLGVLIGGFCYDPCRMARNLAAQRPSPDGATVIGTRLKTTLDMAAFVNATTARYVEANDVYARYKPGNAHGHPSDVIMPLLAAAEHARSSGREFITAVILAYEIYLRVCDVFHNKGFDPSMFGCLAIAAAGGRLMGLTPEQLAHGVSMAVVPNNILAQVRQSHVSMWKAVAAGKAGEAGIFAAMLAQAGMEGPHLPFEGKAGWCAHIARERISLDTLGGKDTPYLILNARIKPRPARALTIASILAAEKIAPMLDTANMVKHVTVEVHKQAKHGTGEHHWHPDTRETADHSIPYVVAAALMEGAVTPRSFNDSMLWNPVLRALMSKVAVVENDAYTRAFEGQPQQYCARVTVTLASGETLAAESGGKGDADDLAAPKSDAQIMEKFRGLTEDLLGTPRVNTILERLWHLEELDCVAEIPPAFVLA